MDAGEDGVFARPKASDQEIEASVRRRYGQWWNIGGSPGGTWFAYRRDVVYHDQGGPAAFSVRAPTIAGLAAKLADQELIAGFSGGSHRPPARPPSRIHNGGGRAGEPR